MLNLIIDCDPGQDDAVAILLALANEKFNILGITTVAGNVSGMQTFLNAKKICKCAGREDVSVFHGADAPIHKKLITAEHIHGKNGLSCDLNIDEDASDSKRAEQFLIETLLTSKEKIIIAATAALTNIALALQKEPKIKDKIEKIVLMGGSTEEGNITKHAEFNFFTDPHAAQIVFESGIDITMIGLNVTLQAVFAEKEIARIKSIDNYVTDHVVTILTDLMVTNRDIYGYEGGIVHDACVIAYLADPSIFKTENAFVKIETTDNIKIGKSYVDFHANLKNANVAIGINTEKLFDFFEKSFRNFSRAIAKTA